MAKIKKFGVIQVPVEVTFIRPIRGRLLAIYVWIRLIKMFSFTFGGIRFFRLAIPRYMVVPDG